MFQYNSNLNDILVNNCHVLRQYEKNMQACAVRLFAFCHVYTFLTIKIVASMGV